MSKSSTRSFRALTALVVAAGALLGSGCRHDYRPYSPEAARSEQVWELGGAKVEIEVAKDAASRERGLMFRKDMPADHGMLFVYPEPKMLRFWMRNCSIPLSIAFFEETADPAKLRVINVDDMQPYVELPGGIAKRPAKYGLEMNQGWFAKHGIKAGDEIVTPDWIQTIYASPDAE